METDIKYPDKEVAGEINIVLCCLYVNLKLMILIYDTK